MPFAHILSRTLVVAFLILGLGACGQDEAPTVDDPVEAGDVDLPWTGTNLQDGSTVRFPRVLDGNPAVLVFWATWCPYCKAFMPYNESILEDYAEHGVQILTFNAKERGRGDPLAYVEGLGFTTISIANADPIADLYGVQYIPGLMVVDGDGSVVYRRGWTDLPAGSKVAQQWDREVREALDQALNL